MRQGIKYLQSVVFWVTSPWRLVVGINVSDPILRRHNQDGHTMNLHNRKNLGSYESNIRLKEEISKLSEEKLIACKRGHRVRMKAIYAITNTENISIVCDIVTRTSTLHLTVSMSVVTSVLTKKVKPDIDITLTFLLTRFCPSTPGLMIRSTRWISKE
jgi:hypothetical protein